MLRLIHMLNSATIYVLLLCLHHIIFNLQKTNISKASSLTLCHDAALASASVTELMPFTHNIAQSRMPSSPHGVNSTKHAAIMLLTGLAGGKDGAWPCFSPLISSISRSHQHYHPAPH